METPISPAIIFVNSDISDSVKATLKLQLFINEEITGEEFDNRLIADPNYHDVINNNNIRLLVVRSLIQPISNYDKANIIIYIRLGMASILTNNIGPHGYTKSVKTLYIFDLLNNVST